MRRDSNPDLGSEDDDRLENWLGTSLIGQFSLNQALVCPSGASPPLARPTRA